MERSPYRERLPENLYQDAFFPYTNSGISEFIGRFIQPGDAVLELGAGTGKLSLHLASHFNADVVTVDFDQEAVNYQVKILKMFEASLGGRVNVIIKHADLFDLPYKPERFDVVFSEGVVEHWTDEKRQRCINVHAHLAKRSVMIITTNGHDPKAVGKASSVKQHYLGMEAYERPYTKSELKSNMEIAGLKDVVVWESKELSAEDNLYLLAVGYK